MLPQELMPVEEGKFHIPADAVSYDEQIKVLNHADTFAIFDRWGDVHPYAKKPHGIFHQGTRFINRLELRLNQKKPLLLSSSIKEDNDILSVDLTNPDLSSCNIPENSVHISRSQFIRNGIYYEELSLVNYSSSDCKFDLTISFGADFRDLFEIRGIARSVNTNKPLPDNSDQKLYFDYEGLDKIFRRTEVLLTGKEEYFIQNNVIHFPVKLQTQEHQKIEYSILFRTEENFLTTTSGEDEQVLGFVEAKKLMRDELRAAQNLFASVATSNEQFTHWINRSKSDLVSLLTKTPFGFYPYAGVPWYNTAFGRDGIITAMEVLWLAPRIARDVLFFLANKQARELIAAKDAEPGKILHETRSGEMANTGEVPFREYYGTIDATPLFIMLAGMYYKRTGDLDTIRELWANIREGLNWITKYGDVDGDGFVEYKHKAENGLTNQGWKDSHDSIMYENGELCEPPIALCEVQGYVYGAKIQAARLAMAMEEPDYAEQLEKEAAVLKNRFNEMFWDEAMKCYVLALDGNKQPCRVIASNPGHCLFTGIVNEARAEAMAKTFMSEQMFSGWGIRTLATGEKRYNPMSYHNGSIWPHDNAVIAYGLARYGFKKEALSIMAAMFDASIFIDMQRLPELYCGFERRSNEGPTAYPVACSPQAWSVAVVFMLIQSCLGIEINALERTVIFHKPELPEYIEKVILLNLSVGNEYCDIIFSQHKEERRLEVMHKPDDWDVMIKS